MHEEARHVSGRNIRLLKLGNTEIKNASTGVPIATDVRGDVDEVHVTTGPTFYTIDLEDGRKTVITDRLKQALENGEDYEIIDND